MIYFSLSLNEELFQGSFTLTRKKLTPEEAAKILNSNAYISLVGSGHEDSIRKLEKLYEAFIYSDDNPYQPKLVKGDQLLVASIQKCSPYTVYRLEESFNCYFAFSLYTIEEWL